MQFHQHFGPLSRWVGRTLTVEAKVGSFSLDGSPTVTICSTAGNILYSDDPAVSSCSVTQSCAYYFDDAYFIDAGAYYTDIVDISVPATAQVKYAAIAWPSSSNLPQVTLRVAWKKSDIEMTDPAPLTQTQTAASLTIPSYGFLPLSSGERYNARIEVSAPQQTAVMLDRRSIRVPDQSPSTSFH